MDTASALRSESSIERHRTGSGGAAFRGQPALARVTWRQWLFWTVACVGFAFDTYEITVFSLVARPALTSFGLQPGTAAFNTWAGWLFYVPMAAGGLFGLVGGYLTDRFGRRGVLVFSIVLYSGAAVGSASATSAPALLAWRSLTLVGACVEFVAGVAWLAELFPEPRLRERMLAGAQAMSALGAFLVTAVYYAAVTYADALPSVRGSHDAWRYALLFGMLPALPLMLVRPFLPESPVWRRRRLEGTLRRPSVRELFSSGRARTTAAATLLMACNFAIAVGVVQQTPRIVSGLPSVAALPAQAIEQTVSAVHLFTNLGNLAGRLLFAWLVVRIAGQRRLLRMFVVPALFLTPLVYLVAPHAPLWFLMAGDFLSVALMVGQLSFWGNYLPRMYPTDLRATGASFATNIGGRLVGTSAVVATTSLAGSMPGAPPVQLAFAIAAVGTAVYIVALGGIRWLPEPGRDALPD